MFCVLVSVVLRFWCFLGCSVFWWLVFGVFFLGGVRCLVSGAWFLVFDVLVLFGCSCLALFDS